MPEELTSFVPLFGTRIGGVLAALYEATLREDPAARRSAEAKGVVDESDPAFYAAMQGAYMPVTPAFGQLLYVLARLSAAKSIVEFGTSFGISTIFLAAALRDNGGGRLITTEFVKSKADRAAVNLERAGLRDLVEIRVGDARESLARIETSVDLLLLDGAKQLYLPVLTQVEPVLRELAIVASDNTDMTGAIEYLEHLRSPTNGYLTTSLLTCALGANHGHEIAIRKKLSGNPAGASHDKAAAAKHPIFGERSVR